MVPTTTYECSRMKTTVPDEYEETLSCGCYACSGCEETEKTYRCRENYRYMQTRLVIKSGQKVIDVMVRETTITSAIKETGPKGPDSHQHIGVGADEDTRGYSVISELNTPRMQPKPPFPFIFSICLPQTQVLSHSATIAIGLEPRQSAGQHPSP